MKVSKFEYAWIWFWYNDVTRMIILTGIYLIPIYEILFLFKIDHESILGILAWIYGLVFFWMLFDNDYNNLRKIGMDEYRRKLKVKENKKSQPINNIPIATVENADPRLVKELDELKKKNELLENKLENITDFISILSENVISGCPMNRSFDFDDEYEKFKQNN